MKQFRFFLVLESIGVGLICLFGFAFFLYMHPSASISRLLYRDDAFTILGLFRALQDNLWVWTNPDISYPFVFDMRSFPVFSDSFFFLLMKFFSQVLNDPSAAMSGYIISMKGLVAGVSYWVCRRMSLGRLGALVVSVLFAFSVYGLAKEAAHMMLASYFIVPLSCYAGVQMAHGRWALPGEVKDLKGPGFVALLLLAVLLASCGIYYAFFSLMFIGVAFLLQFRLDGLSWSRRLYPVAFMMMSVLCLLALGYLSLGEQFGALAIKRDPSDAFFLALKPALLFAPISDHWLPSWGQLGDHIRAHNRFLSENLPLGLFGSLGLGLVFLWLLVRGPVSRHPYREPLTVLGVFCLVGILYGVTGGGSGLFAILVSPNLRVGARISIYLLFFALLGAALLLKPLAQKTLPRGLGGLFLVFVLVFGLRDQFGDRYLANIDHSEYDKDRSYFTQISALLPKDRSAIFIYPPAPGFPEKASQTGVRTEYLFAPYIHTKGVKWSAPMMTGSAAEAWSRMLQMMSVREQLNWIRHSGFGGLLVRRDLVEGDAGLILAQLRKITGDEGVTSDGSRYVYFGLRETPAFRFVYDNASPMPHTVEIERAAHAKEQLAWLLDPQLIKDGEHIKLKASKEGVNSRGFHLLAGSPSESPVPVGSLDAYVETSSGEPIRLSAATAQAPIPIELFVTNRSAQYMRIGGEGRHRIRLRSQLKNALGEVVFSDFPLAAEGTVLLAPGERRRFEVKTTKEFLSRYLADSKSELVFGLIEEGVGWFGERSGGVSFLL